MGVVRLGGGTGNVGLLFRLAELLIVIFPLAGTIIAAIKAFSAQTSGEVSNPAIRFKTRQQDNDIGVAVPARRTASNQAAQGTVDD
jgi:hypothetical protein